jgi:hypothetical protein
MTHIDLDETAVDAILGEVAHVGYLYLILKNAW